MDALTIRLDDSTDPAVLRLEGEIDLATADALRASLDQTLAGGANVVIDLQGVTFLDAAGIRAFLGAAATLNGSGPLRVVNAQRLAWLLDVVGLKDLETIEICDAS